MSEQIIVPSVGLKSQPANGGPNVAVLRAGDLFTERESGWVYGTDAAGHLGYVLRGALGPVGPSGLALPGELPGWRQIFADDFTQPVALGRFPDDVATRWAAYPPGWQDTSTHGTYRPDTVLEVSTHCLRWHLHTAGGQIAVATPMPIIGPRISQAGAAYDHYASGQLYGRVAVCARSDSLPGYKTAFMLWPDSKVWPRDGEIDFPESNLDASRVGAYMHRQGGTGPSDQDAYGAPCDRTQWHVYVTEWRKDNLTFLLDGAVIGHSTARVPNTPMHVNLQAETALSGPLPDPAAAGMIEVDWVAVYTPA